MTPSISPLMIGIMKIIAGLGFLLVAVAAFYVR